MYGELRNIFDLAMAVALIQSEGLAERVGLEADAACRAASKLRLPQGAVPRQVETVINHRVINRRHDRGRRQRRRDGRAGRCAGKSHDGGNDLKLTEQRRDAPADFGAAAWWWDAAK